MTRTLRPRTLVRSLMPIVAVGALVLAGCASSGGGDSESLIRVGASSESISFAPTGQERLGTTAVYDYLFTQKDGIYSPRAAESFEYNEGNTVLTITLRDDLKFSDGTPIDAEVIKADILWSKDNGAFFSAIEDVVVIDDLTLEVRQSQADRNVMLSLWIMPIMTVETTENPDAFAASPVESGPYLLVEEESTSGATYTFERNPDYWDVDNVPYENMTITMLPDDTSRLNALKSGQIDVASVAATTAKEAEGSGLKLTELKSQFGGLIMGDRRGEINPAIADVRVRQAIAMAFDRDAIVASIFSGFASPSSQPFAEGTVGYQDDMADAYSYDPEGAKALLAEAGYPDGFDLTIPTYAPGTATIEPYLKQALADIGVRVTYDAQTDDTWLPAFSGGDYAVVPMTLPFAQSVDSADPEFFWNPWHNDDPDATALLSTINSGTPEEAAEAADALGKIELDDVWFAVYAHPSTVWASVQSVDVTQPQYADWVLPSNFVPAS